MRSLPELVEFIRVSCKSQNSSIAKMEKDLKFANGTVGKWANGKRYPPKDKLLLVADFLQISIEELMGEAPEKKEKPTPSEESELNAHAKAILYKYEQLDPAQRVMFEKMLDAALEAAKGDKNEKG
jgi:transcriptional regulator with XRE-family HTH domain